MQLPVNAASQFKSRLRVFTLPLAHAITIRLFPVNSSAPPTTTRMSPTEKTSPVNSLPTPYDGRAEPALTVVENRAPNEITAPARPLSTGRVGGSIDTLRAPFSSARAAI